MNNRNEFQKQAKKFRSGGISLSDFTESVFAQGAAKGTKRQHINEGAIDFRLPVRPENSHKGDFGRIVLIGGSETMPGAIALAAMASLKSGAGLATVVTPIEARSVVASFSPCLMTVACKSWGGFFSDSAVKTVLKECERADVVVIGPGMGRAPVCRPTVGAIYRELKVPVVVDADAINNLVDANADLSRHAWPRVITPHEGEFARLSGNRTERRSDMEQLAVDIARRNEIVMVLKGPQTLVTDGERNYSNESGNAGMATAGSGDVLAGMIAAFIGQKVAPFDAAKSSCYVHGVAGDIYAQEYASASLIATDLIAMLDVALKKVSSEVAN